MKRDVVSKNRRKGSIGYRYRHAKQEIWRKGSSSFRFKVRSGMRVIYRLLLFLEEQLTGVHFKVPTLHKFDSPKDDLDAQLLRFERFATVV